MMQFGFKSFSTVLTSFLTHMLICSLGEDEQFARALPGTQVDDEDISEMPEIKSHTACA